MYLFSPIKRLRGIIFCTLSVFILSAQDLPVILATKTEPTETGLKIEFQLSSYIERADISSWIEQDKWFILNFYNIIKLLGLALIFQIILGILTILNGAQMFLASMHQIGSIALISISVYLLFLNNRKLTNSF